MKVKQIVCTSLIVLCYFSCYGQGGNHKYVHDKLDDYIDSLKRTPYPYVLPFLGKNAQEKGFDIQRPIGIMTNFTFGEQDISIDRLAVSTDNITYQDVTDIVNFTKVRPHINVVNVRPDVWVLPFLNVSGMVGAYNSTTDVWLDEPAEMKFVAHNKGTLAGFGLMAAGGLGPVFVSYTYNGTWSFSDKLFNSSYTSLNGVRIGHQHKNHRRPQTAWNIWIGAESMQISPRSRGALNLSDLTGMTPEDAQNAADELDQWYNELPPSQKLLFGPIYDSVSNWLKNGEDEMLYYDFDKSIVQKWNMLAGFLYQFNKNWMVSTEGSFVGERWRVVLSLQYRLGIRKHRYAHSPG